MSPFLAPTRLHSMVFHSMTFWPLLTSDDVIAKLFCIYHSLFWTTIKYKHFEWSFGYVSTKMAILQDFLFPLPLNLRKISDFRCPKQKAHSWKLLKDDRRSSTWKLEPTNWSTRINDKKNFNSQCRVGPKICFWLLATRFWKFHHHSLSAFLCRVATADYLSPFQSVHRILLCQS